MKKYFSLASALMLALGMGMTSCSNDLDEVVTEQQPEMHQLRLSANAPETPETRAAIEGVTGKEDAFKITGWKNGDVIYGLYMGDATEEQSPIGTITTGKVRKLAFTYNGTEFVSASTTVTKEDIKYFVYGDFALAPENDGDWTIMDGRESFNNDKYYRNSFALNVDQTNGSAIIPMYGTASINGDKLTANMQMAGMALLCLHNNSNAPITVRLNLLWNNYTYWIGKENSFYSFNPGSNPNMNFTWYTFNAYQNENAVTATTIEAGEKAYFPIKIMSGGPNGRPVRVVVNGSQYKEKELNQFVAGKIYKLNYPEQ